MEQPIGVFKPIDFAPVWLAGKKTTVAQGKTAAAFVKSFRADGSNEYLQNLPDRLSPAGDIIIWLGEYDPASRCFTEIPGVFVRPDAELRADIDVRALPRCTMGVYTVTGSSRDLARGAHNKLVKLMKEAGYAPDYSLGFSMEYYSYEKGLGTYEFSYYLPCKQLR